MWIRWYTVGPQTYMRIGPGGAGSSTFCRVDESYRSIACVIPGKVARA